MAGTGSITRAVRVRGPPQEVPTVVSAEAGAASPAEGDERWGAPEGAHIVVLPSSLGATTGVCHRGLDILS